MKTKKAIEYAPGHVTGFFKIFSRGSTGAGFNVPKAMKTRVKATEAAKNKIEVRINGKIEKAQTSKIAAQKMLKLTKGKKYSLQIRHETKFPIGHGLGLSGAGALSLARALNKALSLGLGDKEVVKIAADADIEAGTGLGDVIAEQYSGMIMGSKPYPSKKALKIKNAYSHAVFAFFGEISTKKIIRSKKWKQKINKTGDWCMHELSKNKNSQNFLHASRAFAIETGLAQMASRKVRAIMEQFPNSSMAMLGNSAFVLTNNPTQTQKKLGKFCKKIAAAKI
ncbi:MAG: hypothetical protein NUV67_01515 [archaeon]|nr:hypothetical protein [archaeon]